MCLVVYARDKPFETSQPSILKVCIPKQPAQASKLGTIITLGTPCLESQNKFRRRLPKSRIMKASTKVTYKKGFDCCQRFLQKNEMYVANTGFLIFKIHDIKVMTNQRAKWKG